MTFVPLIENFEMVCYASKIDIIYPTKPQQKNALHIKLYFRGKMVNLLRFLTRF